MNWIPSRIPRIIEWIYPRRVWRIPTKRNCIYLTFDDGPHPAITPNVLELLDKYDAKATFFCIGDRVKRYPDTFQMILQKGHSIGNHTQHHVKGTKTSLQHYIQDVDTAADYIQSNLFRPPYGRITNAQARALKEKGYEIVMWTILTADYDNNLTIGQVKQRTIQSLKDGNIYVFHDSEKAEERMFAALKDLLEMGHREGYIFKAIGKLVNVFDRKSDIDYRKSV